MKFLARYFSVKIRRQSEDWRKTKRRKSRKNIKSEKLKPLKETSVWGLCDCFVTVRIYGVVKTDWLELVLTNCAYLCVYGYVLDMISALALPNYKFSSCLSFRSSWKENSAFIFFFDFHHCQGQFSTTIKSNFLVSFFMSHLSTFEQKQTTPSSWWNAAIATTGKSWICSGFAIKQSSHVGERCSDLEITTISHSVNFFHA